MREIPVKKASTPKQHKSKSITSIGKYAFKNISSKAKIYVPKKKYSSYKRLLSKAKLSSKVKIVKKSM